ncbi:DUF2807 domain-containing protein [Maribacter sp. RZ05]|uniref:DUF2807 domain-containing protein n=2 Tax=Maribacter luteus TaxID=2594478 RepID=A0A6I2MSC7_9FLAO|nr:DUF2807 domain-containing protein [Maribacter luteus]
MFKGCMIVFLFFFLSCDSENAPDCLQDAGDIVRSEFSLPAFTKITVNEKVGLVLKQGDTQKVEIETGEFLLDEVTAEVVDGRLVLGNDIGCNLFRDYALTTVYVTAPKITEIKSNTGLAIKSDGVLGYSNLTLFSESFSDPEAETTDGEFDLDVDTNGLAITTNGIAYFKLKGATNSLNILVAAGDSRIEAENLVANSVQLNHRGTNDIQVNPQESISGTIRGTGDVISYNRPDTVDVGELYTGKLIFKD